MLNKLIKTISSLTLITFSIYADTTHDAGEILSNVNVFGKSTTIVWPHLTDPNAINQLFTSNGMEAIIGFNGSRTFTYQTDTSQTPTFVEPASNATEETTVYNSATVSGTNFSITTRVRTFDSSYGLLTDAIEYDYRITNNGSATIDEFFAGNYYDFESGLNTSGDSFGYDTGRDLLYQFNEVNGFYIGVRVVSGDTHSAHARPWIPVTSNPFMVSYQAISDGVVDEVDPTITQDLVMTISQRFTSFSPGETIKFVIAVFLGTSLADIQNASDLSFARNSGTANVEPGGFGSNIPVSSDAPGFYGNSGAGGGGCLLRNLK